jgi:membrane protease YdiL (CAAX protease family)
LVRILLSSFLFGHIFQAKWLVKLNGYINGCEAVEVQIEFDQDPQTGAVKQMQIEIMKKQKLSSTVKVIFRILLFVLIGEAVYSTLPMAFWSLIPDLPFLKGAAKGGMAAVGLLILLSWYFLRADGLTLGAIGIELRRKRAVQLLAGIGTGVLMNTMIAFSLARLLGFQWQLNPHFNVGIILLGLFLNCWSATAEELIYRGYAFRKATVRFGAWPAMAAFITLFAVIHIFTWGAWGDPPRMLSVFCTTGLGGLFFSLAFLRTGSVALPSGLHMGFIWANADLFTGMFARWYNDRQGLFIPVHTSYYNVVARQGWLLINLPYMVVLLIAVVVMARWGKRPGLGRFFSGPEVAGGGFPSKNEKKGFKNWFHTVRLTKSINSHKNWFGNCPAKSTNKTVPTRSGRGF